MTHQPLPAAPDGTVPTETCSVCLTDFEADEEIRRLPCRHLFHTGNGCKHMVAGTQPGQTVAAAMPEL